MYGVSVFYEEAANILIQDRLIQQLWKRAKLDIVSRPTIDMVQIEKGKPFIFTARSSCKDQK